MVCGVLPRARLVVRLEYLVQGRGDGVIFLCVSSVESKSSSSACLSCLVLCHKSPTSCMLSEAASAYSVVDMSFWLRSGKVGKLIPWTTSTRRVGETVTV